VHTNCTQASWPARITFDVWCARAGFCATGSVAAAGATGLGLGWGETDEEASS